jgi:hypothetical protein
VAEDRTPTSGFQAPWRQICSLATARWRRPRRAGFGRRRRLTIVLMRSTVVVLVACCAAAVASLSQAAVQAERTVPCSEAIGATRFPYPGSNERRL